MRIECPSCAAGFDVNPSALEPNGRTVRCAACKATWFAPAPSILQSEAKIEVAAPALAVSAEDRADHEALTAAGNRIPAEEAQIVTAEEAPTAPAAPAPPPAPRRKTVTQFVPSRQKPKHRFPLGFVAVLLVAIFTFGIMGRQSIVRAAPEMATLYSAIGFPVNLRGLEFQNIRTRQEIQDGITVLAIEGDVENVANRAVELPRVRLSVLGENGVEIYSWTALLPRSILYPHERVPFKSRLASPPAAGKEIMVRFLARGDLTASVR